MSTLCRLLDDGVDLRPDTPHDIVRHVGSLPSESLDSLVESFFDATANSCLDLVGKCGRDRIHSMSTQSVSSQAAKSDTACGHSAIPPLLAAVIVGLGNLLELKSAVVEGKVHGLS
jgi:hypothetical protein